MVWPKSGWSTRGTTVKGNNASAMMLPGTSLRARAFRESPGDEHDKGRLQEFRRLHAENPAARALDLLAEEQRRHDQRQGYDEHRQRDAANMARRQQGHAEHDEQRGQQKQRLPIDEMEGRQMQPLGHRRAAGHREHESRDDQHGDGDEEPAVDRPGPVGQGRAMRARNHEASPRPDGGEPLR